MCGYKSNKLNKNDTNNKNFKCNINHHFKSSFSSSKLHHKNDDIITATTTTTTTIIRATLTTTIQRAIKTKVAEQHERKVDLCPYCFHSNSRQPKSVPAACHTTSKTTTPAARTKGKDLSITRKIRHTKSVKINTTGRGCSTVVEIGGNHGVLTKSFIKWQQIVLSSIIILLLCCTSHVLAIQKGRLMTPSTFTALSGDLHVQIQFMLDENNNTANNNNNKYKSNDNNNDNMTTIITNIKTTTSLRKTIKQNKTSRFIQKATSTDVSTTLKRDNVRHDDEIVQMENITISTLVISKYIDELSSVTIVEPRGKETTHIITQIPRISSKKEASKQHIQQQQQQQQGEQYKEHYKILQRQRKEIVHNIPVFPDPRHNVTQVKVPCDIFMQGGIYEMQVVTNLKTFKRYNYTDIKESATITTFMPSIDERLKQILDVRWPSADMIISPIRLLTYPDKPVEVTIRFPNVNCDIDWQRDTNRPQLPEFWLELVYCGRQRSCAQLTLQNISQSSILFKEQIRGYPKYKKFYLECHLFGLAGNYAVQLRPMIITPNIPITRRYLSVDWSDKYVFNVYARSIFPCDPHTGIGVLYEYPKCILEQGDRVRVYAKLRADVASLKPPTTLHYVAEQRVIKNQYSLYFNCDLFTEKFIEYCFVYVTQAISGAVADIRMDCLPTLPVKESDTGGWGPWSAWTPCSTSCLGGTRNRYRFCDSPPPRYGAKFCEGPSVETEKCGNIANDEWDCIYEGSDTNNDRSNRTAVSQEIGPGCRCGCIVHLGSSKPKRILAGATQSCPGRSFWLIQVDDDEYISMQLNFLRLPCATQYIKVRDGPSLSSTLVVEVQGGTDGVNINPDYLNTPIHIESSGAQLLLEFFTGETIASPSNENSDSSDNVDMTVAALNNEPSYSNILCTGGFLANVEQFSKNLSNDVIYTMDSSNISTNRNRMPFLNKSNSKWHKFTLVHLSAVIFASIIVIISLLLGGQYMIRYRKYHLAMDKRKNHGSCLHTPRNSLTSLQGPLSRAFSTTTLISEVIYMVKLRPKIKLRHSILRESIDAENLASENEINEVLTKASLANCDSDFGSNNSISTLRNEMISPIMESTISHSSSSENAPLNSMVGDHESHKNLHKDDTLTRKDDSKDDESIISSGMSSICYSPTHLRKSSTIKISRSQLEERIKMAESLRSLMHNRKNSKCSRQTLMNGCYSPATSIISSATIRSTSYVKESKEKQNRQKLLTRPTSDGSLGYGNHDDFELDYYDYNVTNNSIVPGSYLGMDPAYLIWIPPFDDDMYNVNDRDDDKTPQPEPQVEPNETEPSYERTRMPQYSHYLSPHSNTNSSNNTNSTTPTPEEFVPLDSNMKSNSTTPNNEMNLKNTITHKIISVTNPTINDKSIAPHFKRKRKSFQNNSIDNRKKSKSTLSLDKVRHGRLEEPVSMLKINTTQSEHNVHAIENDNAVEKDMEVKMDIELNSMTGSYIEKETTVVKSPSDLQRRLQCQDIQFADESESDHESKTIDVKRTAKEILKEECKLLRNLKRVSTAIAVNKAQTVKSTQV